MKLPKEFYLNENVVEVARNLLGMVLFTKVDNTITAGIITETEAYNGIIDRASHAYGDRRTNRTEIMYAEGGTSYVYLCYGIHSLFNVVTNKKNVPHAVLIRSVIPFKGEKIMIERRGAATTAKKIFTGPGKVSQALGIDCSLTGTGLTGKKIWIEDHNIRYAENEILTTPRIGVDYAGKDALLPYRFLVKG